MDFPTTNYEKERYFEQDFFRGKSLYEAMATCLVVFSGSRAGNHFFPGISTPDSDYDFYISPNGPNIRKFVKALIASGVVMKSPLLVIEAKIATGGKLSLPCWRAELMLAAFEEFWQPHYDEPLMYSIMQNLRKACAEINQDDGTGGGEDRQVECGKWNLSGRTFSLAVYRRDVESESFGYDHASGLEVLRGTTYTGKEVQLIFASGMTAIDHVLSHHCTAAQCGISPYGNVHFYWDLTKAKQAWAWPKNSMTRSAKIFIDRHEAGLAKYRSRGFDIGERPAGRIRTRDIYSEGVRFFTSTPEELSKITGWFHGAARIVNFLATSWYEFEDGTQLIAPPDRRTKQEKAAAAARGTMALADLRFDRDGCMLFRKLAIRVEQLSWVPCEDVINL